MLHVNTWKIAAAHLDLHIWIDRELSSEVVSSVNCIAKNWTSITMAPTNSAHGQAAHWISNALVKIRMLVLIPSSLDARIRQGNRQTQKREGNETTLITTQSISTAH